MLRLALTMLVGDRPKFLGIVLGLAFGALLMAQQGAIFRGVMVLVYNHVTDTAQADIWVGDPGMQEFDVSYTLRWRDIDLARSVDGVAWAVPLQRRAAVARGEDGLNVQMVVLGIDDATLIGAPTPDRLVRGSVEDLRRPDTIIIDEHGAATKLRVLLPDGGSRPRTVGDTLLVQGRTLEVVGICRSTLSLMLFPTAYMQRSSLSALLLTDDPFNLIIVGADGRRAADAVCDDIRRTTGLMARTSGGLADHLHEFVLLKTGIPANFAIAIVLGFLVGSAIAGQTFNQFVLDNRRVIAGMKAMGMRGSHLAGILATQAAVAGVLGYGLGVGAAAAFGWCLQGSDLSFRMEPPLLGLVFIAVMGTSLAAALLSLRSVLRVDPALVFRS